MIATVAGDGHGGYAGDGDFATQAQLNAPEGVFIDAAGHLYIADTGNHRIRKVDTQTGVITTVSGSGIAGALGNGGSALQARLNVPRRIFVSVLGDLYISDTGNNWVRKVDAQTGMIAVVAGSDDLGFADDGIAATEALIASPHSLRR